MEDILIDTDVVIEYLRSKEKSSTGLIKLLRKHDVFLSSISEFELYLGAKTDRHKSDLVSNFLQERMKPKKIRMIVPVPMNYIGINPVQNETPLEADRQLLKHRAPRTKCSASGAPLVRFPFLVFNHPAR